jgi:GntR family transcriptional repressor for pyruvate dehydrogenase complex
MVEDLEYLLLEQLYRSDDGIGSGNLHLELRDRRIQASQATVGRMLRLLDHRKLTAKVSNKGRVLTAAGRRHLDVLRQKQGLRFWAEGVLSEVKPISQSEYLQALDALRDLEGHFARLAAERATAPQIEVMERTLHEQERRLPTSTRGKDQGLEFHDLVAQAAGNRFLLSASQMIWSWNREIRDLWREADVLTGRSSLPDHRRVLRAIAAHNPGGAERAMRGHFADFIETVKRHFADAALVSLNPRA